MGIIACIEDTDIIEKILTRLDAKRAEPRGQRWLDWWSANREKRVRERIAGMGSRTKMPARCRSMVSRAAERWCRWL